MFIGCSYDPFWSEHQLCSIVFKQINLIGYVSHLKSVKNDSNLCPKIIIKNITILEGANCSKFKR